jgi:hypothetical protein
LLLTQARDELLNAYRNLPDDRNDEHDDHGGARKTPGYEPRCSRRKLGDNCPLMRSG